jgi:3D (Asp-Asp-Asp) domain-containing protein
VSVPGYGTSRVDDIGGGVRGNQLDLRFRRHSQAKAWGSRVLTVTVKTPRKKNQKKG